MYVLLVLVVLLVATPTLAQTAAGFLAGTVRDAGGGVLPEATVGQVTSQASPPRPLRRGLSALW